MGRRVADEILSRGKVVLVLGAVDTGKTYLTRELANYLVSKGKKVAIVDSDVGQAYIGPPTTIGLGILDKEIPFHEDIPPSALYFVGSISPVRFLLPTVVGTKLMVEKGKELGADIIIVDTGGLIQNGLGRILKCSKIELVSPDRIIALQRKDELEHILGLYQNLKITIHRLRVSPQVKARTPKMRADYRASRFNRFFEKAKVQELSLRKITLSYKLGKPEDYHHILISLDDEKGEVLSLGVVKEISLAKKYILFSTPLEDMSKVKRIQFSDYRIAL